MVRILALSAALTLVCALALGQEPSSPGAATRLAQELRDLHFDTAQCYRIRDFNFAKEDARFYLTDGYLLFSAELRGTRLAAVFSADVEGGDGELILLPPTRRERASLARFTSSPNLNEHIRAALFLFTDDTARGLLDQVQKSESARRSPEMGPLLAEHWTPIVRSFTRSYGTRIVQDLLSPRSVDLGFFSASVSGQTLGNFDIVFDPRASEQMMAGRVATRDNRAFFDVWTSFEARSYRQKKREPAKLEFAMRNIRIDAALEPDLSLKATTRFEVTPVKDEKTLAFELAREMKVNAVRVNGRPVEVYERESFRTGLLRGNQNEVFLVVADNVFAAGQKYEIEVEHQGSVISQAGNRVYFVGARGVWYPSHGAQFSLYEITFRYPVNLDLVATGTVVEDRTEGEWRITKRRTDSPIRYAGFNLGEYERQVLERDGYKVEVYANRRVEPALQPRPREVLVPAPPVWPQRGPRRQEVIVAPPPPAPNPLARLEQLAREIADGLAYFTSFLGPPALKTLTVSPIPGKFGQGFPGLVYLSTLVYLDPGERGVPRNDPQQTFFSEILHAHETSHQWWGNVVTSGNYQDDWLMEALANYSALLYLEKRKGTRALDTMLQEYKKHLLAKDQSGQTIESAGPLVWGRRLDTSESPGAWTTIIYDKGSWVMHMLRRRLGDQNFLAVLGELPRRYRYQPVTTEQFRLLAAAQMPPKSEDPKLEAFFDQWIYGSGIPELKISWAVKGKAPALRVTGTLTQSQTGEDYSISVPIEVQFRRGKPQIHWLRTSSEPVQFAFTVPQRPSKVTLNPNNSVLVR